MNALCVFVLISFHFPTVATFRKGVRAIQLVGRASELNSIIHILIRTSNAILQTLFELFLCIFMQQF